MAVEHQSKVHAMARVDADAMNPAFLLNRGFSGLTRNGAGDYSLDLDVGVDATERATFVTANANEILISHEDVDDDTIRIRTQDASAMATDTDFYVIVFNLVQED